MYNYYVYGSGQYNYYTGSNIYQSMHTCAILFFTPTRRDRVS